MAPDDDSLGAAAVLSAQLELAATGQARGSLDIAEAWEEGLGRLHPHRSDDQVQENLRDVVLLRARALNLAGSFVESEQHLRKLLGAPLPQRQAVLGHALLGEALGATGRCVEGLDHLEAAMELVRQDRFGLGDIRTSVVGRHIPLLIHSGEYGRARTAISAYAAGDGRDFFFRSGTVAVWQGLLDVRVGRFTRAHDTLLHAVAALRQSDEDVMLPYALGLLCWTAAALGLIDVGLRLHQEFEFLAPRGSAAHLMAAKAYAAAARVRLEPVGDSDAELSALADGAATAGYSGCEKDILQLLVLLGERRHAPRLAQVTEHFEGAEAMLLHEYANALVNNDAGALVQIGDRAEQRGDYLLAVGASTHAVRLFAAQGDHKSQRHVCGVLRRRRALVEGAVVRNAGIEDLTDRESRIAVLAASGGTNRDIAEMLTVSPRTVEGHLYRMYLKLGITGRDELATVVESQVVESDN